MNKTLPKVYLVWHGSNAGRKPSASLWATARASTGKAAIASLARNGLYAVRYTALRRHCGALGS